MNGVSQNEHDEDELVAKLLRPLGNDAAPPRTDVIDRATRIAGEEFSRVKPHPAPAQPERGTRHVVTKAALALSAVALSVVVLIVNTVGPADGSMTLGSILNKQTGTAETLQLRVINDSTEANVWVRASGQVRWEESPSRYRIASGSQLWRIDELANTVADEDNPWFLDEQTPVDLLAILGIDTKLAAEFRQAVPTQVDIVEGNRRKLFCVGDAVAWDRHKIYTYSDPVTDELRRIETSINWNTKEWRETRMWFVARNTLVDESQFVVSKTLSADGRIGKVVEAQGIISLRPLTRSRWTPVSRQMLVKPGDWLRTDIRGANAAAMVTTSRFGVIVGPASLVELVSPSQLRLLRGELKITGSKSAADALELLGPGDQTITIKPGESAHYRVDGDSQLAKVGKKPVWLAGFEGTSNNESIGSLICNIDGRNTPLTVGFHKVKVEIRDQIARTTIEESFVNHTGTRLEGVFHFPLPQDASISGFGMWINGELIEADVVEKQRAREIYETILRERRDPGLLEWTGGNIFKARVFPILPHSEKRIKIVYTQVLPLRANRYRYSYGLASEMLKKTPLRELSLEVLVNSALPLKRVSCSTHEVRSQQTSHSANIEFTAQEYTPTRDFEVVCEVDARQSDVVVVPHRRGDDGYFLVQLTPPTGEGSWQREVIPDGSPLDLLLVCDTSASMDSQKRKQQGQFVTSVLATLGPRDRFNLAACDVNCDWLHDTPVEPTEDAIAGAIGWLDERISLGWTDLDRMATSVLKRLSDTTHVVYIGDGVVTAGDADPQTFANRLKRLTGDQRMGTFHAVSIGSSFESRVLKAVARIGGGSVRHIVGKQTPQQVAFELLNEIAQPGLRNLKVEFRGLQVAAVYPDSLPNLPAGTQQILVGRYLPQGEEQAGEIVITGERGGERVSFNSRLKLADAETGNSFIPRLWARAHLDQLLEEGTSTLVQDQIIALSEEFHIITPYTSLLVLETDEDRERFGVKRRYQMRDGERFFADGRDDATFELRQQQIKRAGDWRLNLRRQILAELTRLGRDPRMFEHFDPRLMDISVMGSLSSFDSQHAWGSYGGSGGSADGSLQLARAMPLSSRWGGDLNGLVDSLVKSESDKLSSSDESYDGGRFNMNIVDWESNSRKSALDFDFDVSDLQAFSGPARAGALQRTEDGYFFKQKAQGFFSRRGLFDARRDLRNAAVLSPQERFQPMFRGRYVGSSSNYVRWLNTLYPTVPPQPAEPKPLPESTWPAAAIDLSRSLVQEITLDAGGIEVIRQNKSADPRWNRETGASGQLELLSPKQWLSFSENVTAQTLVHWCDNQQRGAYSRAFHTGRVRKSTSRDLESLVPGLRAFAVKPLHESYRRYDVKLERPADDRVVMILTNVGSSSVVEQRFVIDTDRNVILSAERRADNKIASSTKYQDYFESAGSWWPAKVETFDAQGRRTSVTTQTVRNLKPAAFARRISQEMPDRDTTQLLPMVLPTVRKAEVAAADGSADFEHRLVLLLNASRIQNWEVVFKQLAEMEKLAGGKPGIVWIRAGVLAAARKNDDVRQLLLEQADWLVAEKRVDEFFLAKYVLGQTGQIADQNEVLRLLERLRPLFERQPTVAIGALRWDVRYTQALRSLRRTAELLPRQHAIAIAMPWDIAAQTSYARDLANSGEHDAAWVWLRQELDRDVERSESENRELRTAYVTLLREQGLADELVTFFEEWVATNPTSQDIYLQHLHAFIMADRARDADTIAREWLKNGRAEGKLDASLLARLNAASSYARGQRYRVYMNWIDPAWFDDLEQTARFFLGHQEHFHIASSIMDHHRFVDSDESDRLRAEVARRLVASAGDLLPVHVASYVRWSVGRSEISAAQWKLIAETLRSRWEKADDESQRQTLGGALLQIYGTHFHDSDHLPFMRQRIVRAEQESNATLAATLVNALFAELLTRGWTAENETEALALIPRLSAAEHPSERWATQVRELHRFVDRMLQARQLEDRKQLQDTGRPEELTRAELAKKRAEFVRSAREGLAARLAESAPEFAGDILRNWVAAERMFLDLQLGRNRQLVAAECWTVLGDAPQAVAVPESDTDELAAEAMRLKLLQDLLRERALAMVSYLAVRRSAPKSLAARVLKYVSVGMRLEGDVARAWQQQRFKLLVALDRPDDLELDLRNWIRADKVPAAWQLALGRLLAEQGEIDEAVMLFETVQRTSQLAPSDHSALADWYLVAHRRAEHDRAKTELFKVMEEYRIQQWLHQQIQPWNQSGVPLPTELDENVLFAFQALFAKSDQPGNYVGQLREFYTACRDFRLLQMVPDALTGRTPQQVYPFLKSLRANLFFEIRKEATADELLGRVAELRETIDSTLDRRALDLLECMIERQAADVLNQPGPHVDAAVTALQGAFVRQWVEGEVRQMADVLADLGKINHTKLNDERLRQLRELVKMTEPATEDRFYVSYYLAKALFYSHGDRKQGLATMENALREIAPAHPNGWPAHPNGWPAHLNPPLDGYVTMLDADGRFAGAEEVLAKYLEDPLNVRQTYWLTQRRNQLYVRALRNDGRVSLGAGTDLFANLEKHLLEQADTGDDNHRLEVVTQILNLYQTASDKRIADYERHFHEFAFNGLPPILKRQTNNYQSVVRQTADKLKQLIGPRVALEFLIERFETYSERFDYTYEAPWRQFSRQLASWFNECDRNIGEYEPRLLAIVLDELRHDLRTRNSRNHYLYHHGHKQYFWSEKSNEFFRVAEEVYQERNDSGRGVTYIARYLDYGLRKHGRAIEILFAAYRKKLLDTKQEIVLCDMLHRQDRHAESIAILQPIVAASPNTMAYRTRLITAYARSSRQEEMRTLLTATDEHFRQQGRWTETDIAQLAWCCLDNKLFAEAAGYYGEVIPLHQRSQPNGGIGDGALSNYYSHQSRAFTGLGDTIKAVDAAAAGVVAWGPRHSNQSSSRSWIDLALLGSNDLDSYVEYLDKQVATTGQDSPLIRQRLGIVYARRQKHEEAIVQLRLAIELQPTDAKTHEALIESYDAIEDQDGAIQQTLAMLDFDRHNLDLYKKLADRLKSDEVLFERAATTIVEAAPHEAEHHQALAEIRQQQDRWEDAIDHWKHVARLRALEPNGLLKLAEAQLHLQRWDGARNSIEQLNQTDWAARFRQVRAQTEQLQRQLPQ